MNGRYGYLIIPSNANIIAFEDDEFGVLSVVKKDTYLYSMLSQLSSVAQLAKKRRANITTFPHFVLTTSGSEENFIAACKKLDAKQEVLARKIPGYPGVLEVVTFEKEGEARQDMQETGRGIKITSCGYVLAKDVQVSSNSAGFVAQSRAIFPNSNLQDDVRQYTFGDCFLLSSMLAILAKEGGDEYVRSMMVQVGQDTVVRLYDPVTLQPLYVRVKNSLYTENGESQVQHRADWVHVLEKAYTALAFKKEHNGFISSFPAFREIFGRGGTPDAAFTILTGKKMDDQRLAKGSIELAPFRCPWESTDWIKCYVLYHGMQFTLEQLPFAVIEDINAQIDNEKSYKEMIASPGIQSELDKRNQQEQGTFLYDLQTYIAKYGAWQSQEWSELREVFGTFENMMLAGKYMASLMPQDDQDQRFVQFQELCKQANSTEEALDYLKRIESFDPPVPEEVVRCYREYMSKEHRWNRDPASGVCTKETDELFQQLKRIFGASRQALVVSTRNEFKDGNPVGLRPKHAYAVTGVYERQVESGAYIKMIQVRNPWGCVGAQYDYAGAAVKMAKKQAMVTEVESPVSEIPMTDFVKYFDSYTSRQFEPLPLLNKRRGEFLQKIYAQNDLATSFLARHGAKILIAMGVTTALVILGILTFGIAPLVATVATVATFASAAWLTAAVAGTLTVTAGALGAALGAITGKIFDGCEPERPTPTLSQPYHSHAVAHIALQIDDSSDGDSETSAEELDVQTRQDQSIITSSPQSEFNAYGSTCTDQADSCPGSERTSSLRSF